MKNCTCKEKPQLTNFNCDTPIIKLFVDECTGCDLYPVTSAKAVLTDCNNNLELELTTLADLIEAINDKIDIEILSKDRMSSLAYKIELLSNYPEIVAAVRNLQHDIQELSCIADTIDGLNLTEIQNKYNTYLNALSSNESYLRLILSALSSSNSPLENITVQSYTDGLARAALLDIIDAVANIQEQLRNGVVSTGGDGVSKLMFFNGRYIKNVDKPIDSLIGSGTYAIHTCVDSIIKNGTRNSLCYLGGAYGGWMTHHVLFKAIDAGLVSHIGLIDGYSYEYDNGLFKKRSGDGSSASYTGFTLSKTLMKDVFKTKFSETLDNLLNHTNYTECIKNSNVDSNDCRATLLLHFNALPDNTIDATLYNISVIVLPNDVELVYDISHSKLGYAYSKSFISNKINKTFEQLSNEPSTTEEGATTSTITDTTPKVTPKSGNGFKINISDATCYLIYNKDVTQSALDINNGDIIFYSYRISTENSNGNVNWYIKNFDETDDSVIAVIAADPNDNTKALITPKTKGKVIVSAGCNDALDECEVEFNYMPGDISRDGRIDVTDIDLITDMVLGRIPNDNLADVGLDEGGKGVIDVADVSRVTDFVLGKDESISVIVNNQIIDL